MSSPLSSSVLKWEDEFNSVETNAENKVLIEKVSVFISFHLITSQWNVLVTRTNIICITDA